MRKFAVHTTLVAGLALAVAPGAMAQMPEGVTQEMIDQGKQIYSGAGICMACHGPEGGGMPNLGADLTDSEWAIGDGSFESILETIREGVSADKSASGSVMPPKGGSQIDDDQLRAVAAYVWSLSNK